MRILSNASPGLYFLSLNYVGTHASDGPIGDGIPIEISDNAKEDRLDLDLRWSDCGLDYADRSQCPREEITVKNLCGSVVDTVGAVISKADVLVDYDRPKVNPISDIQTDARGHFVIEGVESGRYQLLVQSRGFYPCRFRYGFKGRQHLRVVRARLR